MALATFENSEDERKFEWKVISALPRASSPFDLWRLAVVALIRFVKPEMFNHAATRKNSVGK